MRWIAKSLATAVPPLVLSTSLIICNVAGEAIHELVIVVVSVVTVCPNDNALPSQVVFAHTVIPASSTTVPLKVVSAPSVVAHVGVQKTSHAEAPPVSVTIAFATVSNAPSILKIYVPAPLNVIPAAPIVTASVIQ